MTIQICTRDSKKIPLFLLSPHFFKVHYSKQLPQIFLHILSKCFEQIKPVLFMKLGALCILYLLLILQLFLNIFSILILY